MCSAGAPDRGVRRHTLRVEETKSECRQKVEHSCRERAHIARTNKNALTPCTNPMCRHRLSRRPPQQTLFAFILLSSGRSSAPRQSCAVLRQIAMRQKIGKNIPRADSVLVWCCRSAGSLLMVRAPEAIDAIIRRRRCCAGDLQFGRRKATGGPVSTGRENVRYCG